MKTIRDLLKQTRPLADNTPVKLQLHVPLKKVRANAKRLAALGVTKVTIAGGVKPAAKKAASKKTAKKAVKRKPKAATKKRAKAKTPAQRGQTATVTQAAVLTALRARHRTSQAIAKAMKANPVQVTKALSRYTQQGLIVRTQPGRYALK